MTASARVAPPSTRTSSVAAHAVIAAIAYVPLLLTEPGKVAADTRQTMLLDPAGFLRDSLTLWDGGAHLGTVTHQNIGLVFPMGPFFWLADLVGLPLWVAQRLWLGTVLFAAGAGVLYLARTLGWRGAGPVAAAFVYFLSPYVLQYATRTSVILLPWAGLPWLVALTVRSLRTRGWRHPALFALVALAIGTVNATALLLVGLGPLVWLAFAVWVHREATLRSAVGVAIRIGVLTAALSVWWVVALFVQGRYGLPVLNYTETVEQVSTTSSATEALRGLGYWLFYGVEGLRPNVDGAARYLEDTPLLIVSFLLPTLAVVAAFFTRWRYRAFFVTIVALGVIVAVGTYPFDDASPLGRGFQGFAEGSTAGLALRSSTRAVPLVVLGLAVLLGAAVTALAKRVRWVGLVAGVAVAGIALANLPGLFTDQFVDDEFARPEDVPQYWLDAAAYADGHAPDTRVLVVPGIQFASYRWGTTYEPIAPGLLERPAAAREQIPFGSPQSADLLIALDHRMQEGLLEPQELAPVARLMNAGDVLLRSDLEYERYLAPRPRALADELEPAPSGLEEPVGFGEPVENVPDPRVPLLDEKALALDPDTPDPAPVSLFAVDDPTPLVSAASADRPTLLAGDGDGIVDAAAAGLLDGHGVILYDATLESDPALLDQALSDDATLVVTDTNRKRERRWRSTRYNTGFTELPNESLERKGPGEGEADLEVFPDATVDTKTVAEHRGAEVTATDYGDLATFEPEARPAAAFDGDLRTAWHISPLIDGIGERISARLDEPVTTDHLQIVQRQGGVRTRWITEALLHFDDEPPVRVTLDDSSRTPDGQRVEFPTRTFSKLEIEIADIEVTPEAEVRGESPLGFAEIGIPGVSFEELIRLPTHLTDATADTSAEHRLSYVLTRARNDPSVPVRSDEELAMTRVFDVPTDRSFSLSGTARISGYVPDDRVDAVLGAPLAQQGGVTAYSSGRLPGDLNARAASALDGDPSTHWSPAFLENDDAWIHVDVPEPIAVDHLDLAVVADGRHSVPTRVRIENENGESRVVELPEIEDGNEPDGAVSVPVEFAPLQGRRFQVSFENVRDVLTTDYFTQLPIPLPIAIAELGLPGVTAPIAPETLPSKCRDNLVSIDGVPVPVRVVGTRETALDRGGLAIEACDGPVTLTAGEHVVRTSIGRDVGVELDVDRLVLDSAADGAPAPLTPELRPVPDGADRAAAPDFEIVELGDASARIKVSETDQPFWLVLGQSFNEGWRVSEVGGSSLGAPTLVNGYANGWLVQPNGDGPREFTVRWTPQRAVNAGLGFSLAAAVLAVVLAIVGRRWTGPAAAIRLGAGPLVPVLRSPVAAEPRLGWTARIAVAIAAGALGALVIAPLAGAAILAVTFVAATFRRGRALLAVGAVGLVAGGFAWVVGTEITDPRPADLRWFDAMASSHRLALMGVILLLADVAVTAIRRRRPGEDPGPPLPPVGDAQHDMALETAKAETRDEAPPEATRAERLETHRAARKRFTIAATVGGVLAAVVFSWLITAGSFDFFRWQPVAAFYDGQARSLSEGHLDVPKEILGIEAFEIDGRTYMYQGPTPALLRLPIAPFTDALDGRLTQVSMLAAFTVALVFATRLHWKLRERVRGRVGMGRGEALAVGAITFVVGAGSILLFPASRPFVFHESTLWGVACSLVAFDALLGFLASPRPRELVLASAFTTLTFFSRPSVAIGPLVALGLVTLGSLLHRLGSAERRSRAHARLRQLSTRLRWLRPEAAGRASAFQWLLLASAIPVVAYCALNYAKFGTLISVPWDKQDFSSIDTARKVFLEEHGSFFGLQFVPTTVTQYLNPIGIGFDRLYPWIAFPGRPDPIGGVRFDTIDWSAGLPASSPVFFVLGLVGAAALVAPRRMRSPDSLSRVRVIVLGALAGSLAIFPFGFIAQRYLVDLFPLLLLTSLVGLHWLWSRRAGTGRRRVVLVSACIVVLAVFTTWANFSLGLWFQRALDPNAPEEQVASFVDTQLALADLLPTGPIRGVTEGDQLPRTGSSGQWFVLRDCDGLYRSDGKPFSELVPTNWIPVQRTNAAGRFVLDVTFPEQPAGTREPLLVSGTTDEPNAVIVEYLGDGELVFSYEGGGDNFTSEPVEVGDGEHTVEIAADRQIELLQVKVGDEEVLETFYRPEIPTDRFTLGENAVDAPGVASRFTGDYTSRPLDAPVCEELRSRS